MKHTAHTHAHGEKRRHRVDPLRFGNSFKLITNTFKHTCFTHTNFFFSLFAFLSFLFFYIFNNRFSRLSITSVISFGVRIWKRRNVYQFFFLCSCVSRTVFYFISFLAAFAWERDAEKCVQIITMYVRCVHAVRLHKFSIKLLPRCTRFELMSVCAYLLLPERKVFSKIFVSHAQRENHDAINRYSNNQRNRESKKM